MAIAFATGSIAAVVRYSVYSMCSMYKAYGIACTVCTDRTICTVWTVCTYVPMYVGITKYNKYI